MYGRTYDDHRFSPLNQINEQSVANLGLVWSQELDTTRGLEATPIVEDGVIYTTGSWNVVYDDATGNRDSHATGISHAATAVSRSTRQLEGCSTRHTR